MGRFRNKKKQHMRHKFGKRKKRNSNSIQLEKISKNQKRIIKHQKRKAKKLQKKRNKKNCLKLYQQLFPSKQQVCKQYSYTGKCHWLKKFGYCKYQHKCYICNDNNHLHPACKCPRVKIINNCETFDRLSQ